MTSSAASTSAPTTSSPAASSTPPSDEDLDAVRSSMLINAQELAALLGSDTPPRVLDVRWRLDRPDGLPAYREGHIPGAVYVDLDGELAEHGEATDGRHPLPSLPRLQEAARRWGLNDGDSVVVYDDLKNMSSARAWWLLRWAGVADVRLLDGSLRAWTGEGYALETGDAPVAPGSITLSSGALPTLSVEEAAALPEHGILLDARAPERYRGDTEPIDPRAGHIPGARNAPAPGNVGPDGRFLPQRDLRERFEALGVTPTSPVGVYCGSGVTASADAVALTLAGFRPALYPGSWSQWSNLTDRPVAVGDAP